MPTREETADRIYSAVLRYGGWVTTADVARMTGLTKSTCRSYLRDGAKERRYATRLSDVHQPAH